MLAEAASLPIMAVVSLVSGATSAAVTATLAVMGFRGRQKDNARATKLHKEETDRDKAELKAEIATLETGVADLVDEIKDLNKWRTHSEKQLFAVKKSLDKDHLVHRFWPESK